MCHRAFRWQSAAGGLHAISNSSYVDHVFPGDEITTLCGVVATLTRADFTYKLPSGAPVPTCRKCTDEWITREALPRGRPRCG